MKIWQAEQILLELQNSSPRQHPKGIWSQGCMSSMHMFAGESHVPCAPHEALQHRAEVVHGMPSAMHGRASPGSSIPPELLLLEAAPLDDDVVAAPAPPVPVVAPQAAPMTASATAITGRRLPCLTVLSSIIAYSRRFSRSVPENLRFAAVSSATMTTYREVLTRPLCEAPSRKCPALPTALAHGVRLLDPAASEAVRAGYHLSSSRARTARMKPFCSSSALTSKNSSRRPARCKSRPR